MSNRITKDLKREIQKHRDIYSDSTIIYIDGSNLFARSFYATYKGVDESTYQDAYRNNIDGAVFAIQELTDIYLSIYPEFKNTSIIIVSFDNKRSAKHKQINKDYKANRAFNFNKIAEVKGLEFAKMEQEKLETYRYQFKIFKNFINQLDVFILDEPFVEGDFLLVYLLHKLHNKLSNPQHILISNDKDFWQLFGYYPDNVEVYSLHDKKFITNRMINKAFFQNIKKNEIIYARILLGDSSDGIYGIKGIGKKYVAQIFEKINKSKMKYSDIEEFIEVLNEVFKDDKRKVIQRLLTEESQEIIRENFKLMSLSYENIIDMLPYNVISKVNKHLDYYIEEKLKLNKDILYADRQNEIKFLTKILNLSFNVNNNLYDPTFILPKKFYLKKEIFKHE